MAHELTTIEQVRAVIGDENPVVRTKLFQELDATAIEFIRHAPFLLLATSDADGTRRPAAAERFYAAIRDFVIEGPADHGVPGLVQLFGIESPGLTACLAIGEHVRTL